VPIVELVPGKTVRERLWIIVMIEEKSKIGIIFLHRYLPALNFAKLECFVLNVHFSLSYAQIA